MSGALDELADEILVVSAILGDLPAFDDLVRRYRDAVVRVAALIVGHDDAEDVAQESWLLAFNALPSIDDPCRFGAWLKTITKRRALRYIRQKKRTIGPESLVDVALLEQFPALQETSQDADALDAMNEAMSELPDDYALALQMRFYDEMPLKRMASFLEVPVSTIKWRIFRGKQLLRAQLEPNNS